MLIYVDICFDLQGMRFPLIFCQIGDVAAKTEALAMMKAGEVLSEFSDRCEQRKPQSYVGFNVG